MLSQNGNTAGTGISLRLNNGDGTYAAAIDATAGTGLFTSGPLNGISFTQILTNSNPSLYVVDVDNDGYQDLVEFNNGAAGRVVHNNGNGTFTQQASPFATLTFAARAVFGDWNGDGATDVLYQDGNTSGTGIALQLNNGNGTFASAIAAAAPSGTFASGPFNGITFTHITPASTNAFYPH
jgi:hypothetical protein